MLRFATCILLIFICAQAFGTENTSEQSGLLLKVDFRLKDAKRSFQVKNDIILARENNGWTSLTPAQDGVALLGKVNKPNQGVFTIEYMVVDTRSTPVEIHQMGVATQIGQPSSISNASDDGDEIAVSLIVTSANYRPAKSK